MNSVAKKEFSKEINLGILLVTSLLFPMLFHVANINGRIFLPIFLSLTIGTLFVDKKYLTVIALLSPLLNMLIFKMPAPLMAYILMFEGLVFVWVPIKNIFLRLLVTRVSSILLSFVITGFAFEMWKVNFLDGILGIVLNGAVVFLFSKVIKKNNN